VHGRPAEAEPANVICAHSRTPTNTSSAQGIQRQKVHSNAVKSKPNTISVPSSSASAMTAKNQSKRVIHNPNSVANIQRQLDPLAFDPTIQKLTN